MKRIIVLPLSVSLEYQRCEPVGSKQFLRHGLYAVGRYGVDAVEESVDVASVAVVEECPSEVEGKALAIVASLSLIHI